LTSCVVVLCQFNRAGTGQLLSSQATKFGGRQNKTRITNRMPVAAARDNSYEQRIQRLRNRTIAYAFSSAGVALEGPNKLVPDASVRVSLHLGQQAYVDHTPTQIITNTGAGSSSGCCEQTIE
jgi:hypothetical protein